MAPSAAECLRIGGSPDPHARTFTRILGARHLLQAAANVAFGGGAAMNRLSGGVDALHAFAMLVLAALDRRRRNAAVANAAIALAFAAAEIRSGTLRARVPGQSAPRRYLRRTGPTIVTFLTESIMQNAPNRASAALHLTFEQQRARSLASIVFVLRRNNAGIDCNSR
jgi:hypothetical protein